MLREAGAASVHIKISSPPVKWPCFYGINFASPAELIANGATIDEITQAIGADSLAYISEDGMIDATRQPRERLCTACFTGKYPIELPGADGSARTCSSAPTSAASQPGPPGAAADSAAAPSGGVSGVRRRTRHLHRRRSGREGRRHRLRSGAGLRIRRTAHRCRPRHHSRQERASMTSASPAADMNAAQIARRCTSRWQWPASSGSTARSMRRWAA